MFKQPFLLALLLATGLITSCKKDKENPTITVTQPAEHSIIVPGEAIQLKATFADDRDLASYSMMVGDEDGNHIDGFHHDDDGQISGKTYDYSASITTPDSVTVSMFYIHIKVLDAEGKEGKVKHMLHF